jgi:hypothetical protein
MSDDEIPPRPGFGYVLVTAEVNGKKIHKWMRSQKMLEQELFQQRINERFLEGARPQRSWQAFEARENALADELAASKDLCRSLQAQLDYLQEEYDTIDAQIAAGVAERWEQALSAPIPVPGVMRKPWESLYRRTEALRAENERLRDDHGKACKLVSDMHYAATGSITGPKRGVVEDIADLRAVNERLLSERDVQEAALSNVRSDFRELARETEQLRQALVAVEAAPAAQPEPKTYTEGHCANHTQPGGCQLHNLQCGYPDCDRRPVKAAPPGEPVACIVDGTEVDLNGNQLETRWVDWMPDDISHLPVGTLLYAAPPVRTLTDAQIGTYLDELNEAEDAVTALRKIIEAAIRSKDHG